MNTTPGVNLIKLFFSKSPTNKLSQPSLILEGEEGRRLKCNKILVGTIQTNNF